VTGIIGFVRGKPVGVGGVAHVRGYRYAFIDIQRSARIYKKEIYWAIKEEFQRYRELKVPAIFAEVDQFEEGAERLFTKLGFRPYNANQQYWVWTP